MLPFSVAVKNTIFYAGTQEWSPLMTNKFGIANYLSIFWNTASYINQDFFCQKRMISVTAGHFLVHVCGFIYNKLMRSVLLLLASSMMIDSNFLFMFSAVGVSERWCYECSRSVQGGWEGTSSHQTTVQRTIWSTGAKIRYHLSTTVQGCTYTLL